eukprot:SAG31_NODE_1247_length_9127_cov_2.629929_2_plen_1146_part_00
MAVNDDGQIFTWGCGSQGQLGHGVLVDELTPREMQHGFFASDSVRKSNEWIQAMRSSRISCGASMTAVVVAQQLIMWGLGNVFSPAQDSANRTSNTIDPNASILSEPTVMLDNSSEVKLESVAIGHSHVLLLDYDGDVWSWGKGEYGQLGDGSRGLGMTPRLVLAGKNVNLIVAGRYHSLAVTEAGWVYSWGCDESGQLGHSGIPQSLLSGLPWAKPWSGMGGVDAPLPCWLEHLEPYVLGVLASGHHHCCAISSHRLELSSSRSRGVLRCFRDLAAHELELKCRVLARETRIGQREARLTSTQVLDIQRAIETQYIANGLDQGYTAEMPSTHVTSSTTPTGTLPQHGQQSLLLSVKAQVDLKKENCGPQTRRKILKMRQVSSLLQKCASPSSTVDAERNTNAKQQLRAKRNQPADSVQMQESQNGAPGQRRDENSPQEEGTVIDKSHSDGRPATSSQHYRPMVSPAWMSQRAPERTGSPRVSSRLYRPSYSGQEHPAHASPRQRAAAIHQAFAQSTQPRKVSKLRSGKGLVPRPPPAKTGGMAPCHQQKLDVSPANLILNLQYNGVRAQSGTSSSHDASSPEIDMCIEQLHGTAFTEAKLRLMEEGRTGGFVKPKWNPGEISSTADAYRNANHRLFVQKIEQYKGTSRLLLQSRTTTKLMLARPGSAAVEQQKLFRLQNQLAALCADSARKRQHLAQLSSTADSLSIQQYELEAASVKINAKRKHVQHALESTLLSVSEVEENVTNNTMSLEQLNAAAGQARAANNKLREELRYCTMQTLRLRHALQRVIGGVRMAKASNQNTKRELQIRIHTNGVQINDFEEVLAEAAEADLAKVRIIEARRVAREEALAAALAEHEAKMAAYREARRAELALRISDSIAESGYKRIFERLKAAANASTDEEVIQAWDRLGEKKKSLESDVNRAEQQKFDLECERELLFSTPSQSSQAHTSRQAALDIYRSDGEGIPVSSGRRHHWAAIDDISTDISVLRAHMFKTIAATHELEDFAAVLRENLRGKICWMIKHRPRPSVSNASTTANFSRLAKTQELNSKAKFLLNKSVPRDAAIKAAIKLRTAVAISAGSAPRRKKRVGSIHRLELIREATGTSAGVDVETMQIHGSATQMLELLEAELECVLEVLPSEFH